MPTYKLWKEQTTKELLDALHKYINQCSGETKCCCADEKICLRLPSLHGELEQRIIELETIKQAAKDLILSLETGKNQSILYGFSVGALTELESLLNEEIQN